MEEDRTVNEVLSEAPKKVKKKKRRILLKIFLILLALIVLACLGGYVYWAVQGSRLDLPYGLKAGMDLEEIRAVLADSGFREEYVESKGGYNAEEIVNGETKRQYYVQAKDVIVYTPKEVFGVTPVSTDLEKRETSIELSWRFRDTTTKTAGSTERVLSPEFKQICAELEKQYGSPTFITDVGGGYRRYEWSGIHWNMDSYRIAVYYFSDDGYSLYYRWEKSNIF